MLKRESFASTWTHSLSIRLEFDERCQELAGRWVESLYRRRGYSLKLQVRLHKVEDLIVHDRPILALVEPVAFLVHDQPLRVATDFL